MLAASLVAGGLGYGATTVPARDSDTLHDGFVVPPQSAKPRVWWHWMNGNITRTGIKADLDWMHRIGIGGANVIDAALDTPQVVDKRLIYMEPDWKDAFHYAAGLAAQYGMEFSIDSSPGWSETGGPWVLPQQAMKKLVWSATVIAGGRPFHGVLPSPPDNSGPFQNTPMTGRYSDLANAQKFYRDTIVVAYKQPTNPAEPAEVRTVSGPLNLAALANGDVSDGPVLSPDAGNRAVIEFRYAKPVLVQGLTLAVTTTGSSGADAVLEASDDGSAWHMVTRMAPARSTGPSSPPLVQQTVSFKPVTARFFRLALQASPNFSPNHLDEAAPGADVTAYVAARTPKPEPVTFKLHELVLKTAATVHEFEQKAGFAIAPDNYVLASGDAIVPGTAVAMGDVIDLTSHMKPDGTLDWAPPAGQWTVLRMGYSLEGKTNHPATREATGLEVDKLNVAHVRDYMNKYLDTYAAITKPDLFGKRGLGAMTVDSTEIGAQNWTESILSDFQRLQGYDPRPWLPVLTGVVVKSPGDSDRFLWDFRNTIAELLAENHYHAIAGIARERGLVNYGEALEHGRPTFGDDMRMRQYADIPMAAMWSWGSGHPDPSYLADIQGAASVAHVYGQNLVAAESMTSALQPWAYAPRQLKPVIDLEFVLGVNRVVYHSSVHQPVDKAPGMTLGPYGQYFNRLESWANNAGPWITYMARTSYMLQQGRFVADIAYFYGEDTPITGLFGDKPVADVPKGHAFDFVDADALRSRLSVADGALVTPSGMHYKVLYLGGSSQFMTLGVLRRIRELAKQGAVVVGKRPQASPSLKDDPDAFAAAVDALFGPAGSVGERMIGKGRVFPAGSLGAAFAAMGLAPDFAYGGGNLMSLHRSSSDADIYFVINRDDHPVKVDGLFRATGRRAELWDAVTGSVHAVASQPSGGRTEVAFELAAHGSTFVVLRGQNSAAATTPAAAEQAVLQTLDGAWTVSFQPNRGAAGTPVQKSLASWSEDSDPGIRYFSGTASYAKDFDIPAAAIRRGRAISLDLGEVRELAEVTLNGKSLGMVWTSPYKLDISAAIRPGKNRLTVAVTNLWVNRLIGDQQPGAKARYTFTTAPTYRPDAPLRSSGLLGPVRIVAGR